MSKRTFVFAGIPTYQRTPKQAGERFAQAESIATHTSRTGSYEKGGRKPYDSSVFRIDTA